MIYMALAVGRYNYHDLNFSLVLYLIGIKARHDTNGNKDFLFGLIDPNGNKK
jgi:hypothetical protein